MAIAVGLGSSLFCRYRKLSPGSRIDCLINIITHDDKISYFRDYYKELIPACLIIYDRVAYFEPNGDLRLTIDYNPRYRMHDLDLITSMDGTPLLNEGETILEIKVQGSMPLWLTHILDEGKMKKSSFSS